MVTGDTNGTNDIMIRNRLSNTTTMVSKGIGGTSGDDRSLFPSISGDGKLVAYQSLASNLVAGDTNGVYDIFVTRVSTGATERISKSAADGQSLGNSEEPWLSADGRYIGFSATATNLVAGDTNGVVDVFLATRAVMTTRVTRTPSAYSRTYSRIHGVAKYTLSATLGNEIGVPIAGARAYLQRYNTSSKKWKNLKPLRSNSRGKVGVVFRSTATSTRYYRWYVPAAADHTKAYGSKQKIRVK